MSGDLPGEPWNLSIFLSCRQLYHEAGDAIYGKVTFSFAWPETLCRFIDALQDSSSLNAPLVRKLHLDITVRCKSDEADWDAALQLVLYKLTSLKTIHIGIDQKFDVYKLCYTDVDEGQSNFLLALRELRKLPLTNATTVILSSGVTHRKGSLPYSSMSQSGHQGGRTHAQRKEWSRYMRDTIISVPRS